MRVFMILILISFQASWAFGQEDVGYSYSEPAPAPNEEANMPPPSEDSYAAPVVEDYSPSPDYHSGGSESGDF